MSGHGEGGTPLWFVSFTDMISLLCTFFIMLMTFSTTETEKFNKAAGSIRSAIRAVSYGISTPSVGRNTPMRQGQSETQGTTTPPETEPIEDPTEGLDLRLKKALGEEIETDKLREGFRIRITADTLFEPGSAELSRACRKTLEAVAKAIASLPHPIRIEGHTDAATDASSHYPTPWHLSAERAAAAARHLARAGPIAPQRISIAACADTRPARADGPSPRNRRIEITILSLSEQR
jgi:chemotaxis protein MotB